jgi:hypothetical protein
MGKPAKQNKRRYLISLYHTRSVLALDAARTGRKRRKTAA